MSGAPLPPNEAGRIEELESLRILDTYPELSYDDITRLAAQICDVPIALISLVDKERQWFKSRIGLGQTETPRDVAFCAHAIIEPSQIMVVPDATVDERFFDNPLVQEGPKIRFYAGAPLVTESGNALGTLCVMDRQPRLLTTDQRQALAALARQVVAQLSLRQALAHMNQQQQELVEAMRQRDNLVAAVSHELRTPLTAVLGFINVLRDEEIPIEAEDRKEYLDTASQQALELSNIIDDLLVAARLEQNTLRVTRVPVNLQAQVAQVLEGIATERDLQLDLTTSPVHAWGDPGRVRQIVRNLVTNAIRYGGSEIKIETHCRAATTHITVRDSGTPIPEEDRDRIFSPYRTSESRHHSAASVGLGLSVSRQLARLMDGELTYNHDQAHSIFELSLPAHAPTS